PGMGRTFRISDPRILKAVAHPLHVRMLGLLRADGPATATELARKVGESSGLTSHHLRALAKYGFIEEDPEQRDARERRWRAVHRYTSWNDTEMAATPEGAEAAAFLRRRQLDSLVRRFSDFEAERSSWSPEWQDAAGMSDHVVRLTPRSLAELRDRITALVEEY